MTGQVVENIKPLQRHVDCYIEGASDVEAAGKESGQAKRHRRPARATANERPSKKGKPAGEVWKSDGEHSRSPLFREASDFAQIQSATPMRVALCGFWESFSKLGMLRIFILNAPT